MKSFLEGMRKIEGDFRPLEFYSLYARPSAGKSLYLLEEASNLISQGATVIYLNTETGFGGQFDHWKPVFEKKYGIELDEKTFRYYRLWSYEELMNFLNLDVQLTVSAKGTKMSTSFTRKPVKTDTLLRHIARAPNPVIMLDSFTAIFKEGFNTAVENFSARADASAFLFMGLNNLIKKLNAFIFITHHASVDPMNLYHQMDKIYGGNNVLYYSKYIVYMEKQKKKTMQDYRKLYALRTAIGKDWGVDAWVRITDDGYQDITQEEAEEAYDK